MITTTRTTVEANTNKGRRLEGKATTIRNLGRGNIRISSSSSSSSNITSTIISSKGLMTTTRRERCGEMARRRDGHIIVHKEAHVRLGAWVFGAGYRQYPRVWFLFRMGF